MYDAGYQSSRAFYATARDQLGMSPGAYKASGRGERVVYGMVDSPLGRMLIAATERGVCALRFGQDDFLVRALETEFASATLVHDPTAVAPYAQTILGHLAGRQLYLDVPFDVQATDFQQSVWAALRQIPYGETRTYKEVAEMIGRPSAVRAVAQACATNPVPLIVPCHRVVRANGELGGYRWGAERKQILLRGERNRGQPVG